MHDKQNTRVGGASIDKLERIILSGECPHGDDDPIPWDDQWFTLFFPWNTYLFSEKKTGILIFSPHPNSHEFGFRPKTLYTIGGQEVLNGGVYIVGKASSGHAKIIDESGDFQSACEIVEQHVELSTLPTIILGRREKIFFYYPNGIANDQNSLQLSCIITSFTLDGLLACLDTHANVHLQTPEFRNRIWENASKWWAKEQAESIVQNDLLAVLRNRYHQSHTIDSEQTTTSGRVDIKCVPKDGQNENHGILELKAIRTFGSNGNKYKQSDWAKALKKGAGQAFSYAKDNNASIKILCVFDMRKVQDCSCLDCGKKECDSLDVTFAHYVIANSSQQIRDIRVAAAQNTVSL